MYTTSFNHKYQVGDHVWMVAYYQYSPVSFEITSVSLERNKNVYRSAHQYLQATEDMLFDSREEAQQIFDDNAKKTKKFFLENRIKSLKSDLKRIPKELKKSEQELKELNL